MPAPNSQYQIQEIPLKIVGGVNYGRYPKISQEQTWNFIVSDGFLVPYAGYKNQLELNPTQQGRGLYASYRSNQMYAVIGSTFYVINQALQVVFTHEIYTNEGDVWMTENNGGQITITDNQYMYVYRYAGTDASGNFRTSNPTDTNGFVWPFPGNPPGFVSFQNGRTIAVAIGSTNWALSKENDSTVWSSTDVSKVGSLQAKPDYIQAAVPLPSAGNNLLVFGRNVVELWQDVGAAKFPYQRASTFDIDYGCINPASIASLGNYVVWIGVNEQSGPVLMVAVGNQAAPISTDGIDYKLGNLSNPQNCTGFLYQQDGHLLYQFTFPDDNISYAYDFNTKLFFNVSDENLNYHIARQIVYFNDTYYFVSLNGGNIYEFDTKFPDAEYETDHIKEIPRIRITPPFRFPSQRMFIIKSLGFTVENGLPNIVTVNPIIIDVGDELLTEAGDFISTEEGELIAAEDDDFVTEPGSYVTTQSAIYLSISRDGGVTYGSELRMPMNPTGKRKSRMIFQRLGQANDVTFQLKFVGVSRFVCTDGELEVYQ